MKLIPGDEVITRLKAKNAAPLAAAMTGYECHPEAEQDLDQIAEFVASHSLDAAEKLADEIIAALDSLVRFPY